MEINWSDVLLGALVTAFFLACAWACVAGRIAHAERNLFEDLEQREPIDGRWCPNRGCQGLLAYKRAREWSEEDQAYRYLTYLTCWRCGDRLLLHSEREYSRRED
jgi:hypothetical protein